jgi:hypothetical protein
MVLLTEIYPILDYGISYAELACDYSARTSSQKLHFSSAPVPIAGIGKSLNLKIGTASSVPQGMWQVG